MRYEKFLADSGVGKDVSRASFDTQCLLDPNLLAWGREWVTSRNKPSLILQGKPGCGKTFFSIALLRALWGQLQPYPFIIFKISSQLDSQLLSAVMGKSSRDAESIIKMCSESTLFILDDLGVETSSERVNVSISKFSIQDILRIGSQCFLLIVLSNSLETNLVNGFILD